MCKEKFTIKDFNEKYPDDNACLHDIFTNRYAECKECTECLKPFKYYKVSERKCYACAWCGHQLHPLADTVFHKSSTSLKGWFYAIFLFSASKNGVSGKELERQLGVTYKTAWRMAKQIRQLFNENVNPLGNVVEVDETYVGGKEKNKHKSKRVKGTQGRSTKTKIPVIGAVEREGDVIAKVVSDTKSSTIQPFLREHVDVQAKINTDEYRSYNAVSSMGYKHERVNHSADQYVKGDTHTNTIEGFWSQFKRSVHGTYHAVSPKYLQSYVNEFSYRYNKRNQDKPLFSGIIQQAAKLY